MCRGVEGCGGLWRAVAAVPVEVYGLQICIPTHVPGVQPPPPALSEVHPVHLVHTTPSPCMPPKTGHTVPVELQKTPTQNSTALHNPPPCLLVVGTTCMRQSQLVREHAQGGGGGAGLVICMCCLLC